MSNIVTQGKWSVLLVLSACTVLPQMEMPICRENCAPYEVAAVAGRIENRLINEASGLAGSIRHDNLLWVHNDSGDSARLFAISPQGRTLGSVVFPESANVDWEDLTSFTLDGEAYLAIADTGDNMAIRRRPTIHIVKEPDFPSNSMTPQTQGIAWSIPFRFEDGARDCESIAIDVVNRRVLLLTKREVPPGLYELPLVPTDDISVARRLLDVPLPQPTPQMMKVKTRQGRFSAQPTAMDISQDGRQAVVLTYRNAFHFHRDPDESWETAFARDPKVISLPPMDSGEALAFNPGDGAVYVTAERHPAPVVRVRPK